MSSMSGYNSSGLKGSGYQQLNVPRMGQAGQDIWQQLYKGSQGGVGSSLQGLSDIAGGDQSKFAALEAPARRQFEQDQSQIASRFSGMGSGARRSSGHANAQSGAAVDLAERLQGQRLGLQQNAWKQLLGIHSDLMANPTHESFLMKDKEPAWKKWTGASLPWLGGAAGAGLGGFFGGPAGALAGAKIGSQVGGYGSKGFFGSEE
jgi:hypothetical protein